MRESVMVHVPKGDEEGGVVDVIREAVDLRPLAAQCTDLKAICSVAALAAKLAVCARAHVAQRGFVPGRRLTDNILEFDALARIQAHSAPKPLLPVLIQGDFLAAFPSLDRGYMLEALDTLRLLEGLVLFVKSLCEQNLVCWRSARCMELRCSVMKGIKGGCMATLCALCFLRVHSIRFSLSSTAFLARCTRQPELVWATSARCSRTVGAWPSCRQCSQRSR